MPRRRPSDTKARIQAVARELFAQQGVQPTSLREIADRLGITKAALYYHFDSREALVRSIIEPVLDEFDAFIVAREGAPRPEPRVLLADYFELLFRNRETLVMLVNDLAVLGQLDLGARTLEWRRRLMILLLGPEPPLAERARAIIAIGGMADCAVELAQAPLEQVEPIAVEAACAALGLPPGPAAGASGSPRGTARRRPARPAAAKPPRDRRS